MNKRGSSNIQGDARVYGPSVGLNSGTIHTTYHITHQYSAANPYLVDEQALASASARLAELPEQVDKHPVLASVDGLGHGRVCW